MSIKISQLFFSLQGEGKYVGQPSIFLRTFGCNFRCKGFGMLIGENTTEVTPIIEQHKEKPFTAIKDMPMVATGCDTYYAIYPAFKNLATNMTTDEIVDKIESLRCEAQPAGPVNGIKDTHIVITGGEPLLGWQKEYPALFDKLAETGYRNITFETNGTQQLSDELYNYIALNDRQMNFTFSVSPKLGCSGESSTKALKPEIVEEYSDVAETYLKFVVADEFDLEEANGWVEQYKEAGFRGDKYIMPCGGESELYQYNSAEVARLAIYYNYKFSPRLHVDIWNNDPEA